MMEDEMTEQQDDYPAARTAIALGAFNFSTPPGTRPFRNEYEFHVDGDRLLLDFFCDDYFYNETLAIPLAAFQQWLDAQRKKGGR